MANTTNLFISFLAKHNSSINFDSNNIGNYIGKINDVPAVVGSNAVALWGNSGKMSVNATGIAVGNTSANVLLSFPNTSQISNNGYYLNANGQWGYLPPGLTTNLDIYYTRLIVVNGLIVNVETIPY